MPNFYGVFKDNDLIGGTLYTYYTKIYKIIYDGEIYNSVEIKMELIELGHTFSTFLEEEIVLKAYIEWGSNTLSKFDGVFSIAIFDVENNRLFMAVDFLGIKPIYYRVNEGELVFANRIEKLNLTKYTTTYDKMANLFLFNKDHINGKSIVNSVNILLPSSFLVFDGEIELHTYERVNKYDDYIEKIYRRIIPETNISTILIESDFNIVAAVFTADMLNRINKKPNVFSYDAIDKIKNNYEVEEKRILNDFSINNFYKLVRIKEIPSENDFSKFYLALKSVKDKLSVIVSCVDYGFYKYNYDLINMKKDLFSKEFEENVHKEKIINKFDQKTESILKNREKIAKYFGLTLRDAVIENKREFFKNFYELIKLNSVKIPRSYDKVYVKTLFDEYEHILNVPTARIFEVLDREKMKDVKDIRIVTMVLELNYWLKEYNVEIR
ncbi:MAG: hypothetical protein IJS47_00790 [Clostridia bacterium]|nr:hypothetical protein [Clostridia bacterium]